MTGGGGLLGFVDSKETGRETIEGTPCVRIEAHQAGSPITLWLGEEDLLIRRVFQAQSFDADQRALLTAIAAEQMDPSSLAEMLPDEDFETETETLYFPSGDAELPAWAHEEVSPRNPG